MSVSLVQLLKGIADAIREKKGTTGKINAQNMAFEIKSIEPPLDTIELKDPGKYDVKDYKYAQVLPSDVVMEFIGVLQGTASEVHIPEGTTTLRQYAIKKVKNRDLNVYFPKSIESFVSDCIILESNDTSSGNVNVYYAGTLQEWYDLGCNIRASRNNSYLTGYYFYVNNELITEINSFTNFNKSISRNSPFANMRLDRVFIPNGSTLSATGALGGLITKEIVFEGTIEGTLPTYCFNAPSSSAAGAQTIVLPTNITTIPQYCFYGNAFLKELTIPEGVTSIEDNAFSSCFGGNGENGTLYLPSTLTSIGRTFGSPTHVILNCVVPPTTTGQIFNRTPKIIYIPAGTLTSYQTATNWSAYSDVFVEMNEVALNVQAEIINNENYQYSLDGGVTWSVFATSNINLEQIALIKFKNTSETTKLLIGKTAGATDIGSITDAELSYATEGSMTIYLRLEEITA